LGTLISITEPGI